MNMMQLKYGNELIRAFFNLDHKTGNISDVELIDNLDRVFDLKEKDLPHIIQLLKEEVHLSIVEAAMLTKAGMTFDA